MQEEYKPKNMNKMVLALFVVITGVIVFMSLYVRNVYESKNTARISNEKNSSLDLEKNSLTSDKID